MASTCVIHTLLLYAAYLLLAWHTGDALNVRSDSASPIVNGDPRNAPSLPKSDVEANVLRAISDSFSNLRSAANDRAFVRAPTLTSLARQEENEGGQALDGDSCETNDDCLKPRRCLETSSRLENVAQLCSNSSSSCFCVNHRICVSAKDCDEGEECALDVGYPTCVSVRVVEQLEDLSPVASPGEDAPSPVFGFTGELCSTDADCQDGRKCRPQRQPASDEQSCGPKFMTCSCVPETPILCEDPVDEDEEAEEEQDESMRECPEGELCQMVGGAATCYTAKVSVKNITEAREKDPPPRGLFVDSGAEEDVVCIATHMLSHLQPDELLFSTPRIARVLCDSNDSCATPGHMVSYKGKVMMMKTYCELRGCNSKLMYVNSPRFRRAMRIESNSESLSFTALAARYETRSEERLISLAVRVGLL